MSREEELAAFEKYVAEHRAAQALTLPRPVLMAYFRSQNRTLAAEAPPRNDDLASHQIVVEKGVEGEWSVPKTIRGGAVLYLHGGSFKAGSAASYRKLVGELAVATAAPAFALDFGLAPESPLPGPHDDVQRCIAWLAEGGYPTSSLVIAGDSSGCTLALVAAMRLRDRGLPLPAGLYLLSPSVNWAGFKRRSPPPPYDRNPATCPLGRALDGFFEFVPPDSPEVSPLLADLSGLPPMLVQVGGRNSALRQAEQLKANVEKAEGSIVLQVWPEMPHVFQFSSQFFTENARLAIQIAGSWMGDRIAAPSQAAQRGSIAL